MPVIVLNWRRMNWRLFSVSVLVFTIVFNEYIIYLMQSWRWPTFPKSDERKHDVVMLLVGDPQLQGYRDEPPSLIGSLSRWDADRYLRNNYLLAMSYLKPDVVIFMGDLLDEGSIATDSDYTDYKKRFDHIFKTLEDVPKVYIPGDNDVGGEGRDYRTKEKLQRFIKNFQELTSVRHVKFVDLITMDIEFHKTLTPDKKQEATGLVAHLSSPYRVLLNHESVSTKLKVHIYPLLSQLRPNLILSAHWHKSNHYVCDDCMSQRSEKETDYWPVHRRDLTEVDHLIQVDLHKDKEALNEFMIPSCSYRMGETNIGYGVLVISDSGMAHHAVLWLPQRYTILYGYILVLTVLICLYAFLQLMAKKVSR